MKVMKKVTTQASKYAFWAYSAHLTQTVGQEKVRVEARRRGGKTWRVCHLFGWMSRSKEQFRKKAAEQCYSKRTSHLGSSNCAVVFT